MRRVGVPVSVHLIGRIRGAPAPVPLRLRRHPRGRAPQAVPRRRQRASQARELVVPRGARVGVRHGDQAVCNPGAQVVCVEPHAVKRPLLRELAADAVPRVGDDAAARDLPIARGGGGDGGGERRGGGGGEPASGGSLPLAAAALAAVVPPSACVSHSLSHARARSHARHPFARARAPHPMQFRPCHE
eukprot:2478199-Prymnesium_polylepis.1